MNSQTKMIGSVGPINLNNKFSVFATCIVKLQFLLSVDTFTVYMFIVETKLMQGYNGNGFLFFNVFSTISAISWWHY